MMQPFDGILIGEALVGEGPEIAHIDLVIGPKGCCVEQAFVSSLASPAMGHTPLLAVLEPNLPAKPATLMVNKVTTATKLAIERAVAKNPGISEILAKKDFAKHPFA